MDVEIKERFNKKLNELYDGYHFGGDMRIFNARQVVNCLRRIDQHGKFPNLPVDVNTNLSESVPEFMSQCTNMQLILSTSHGTSHRQSRISAIDMPFY